MKKILKTILGDPENATLKRYYRQLHKVNDLENKVKTLKDSEFKQKTAAFKARLAKGESLDDLLPEAFAVVREVAARTLKQRHYDVQIIGGMCLHEGKVAEMRTGEGKTLVATLPLYLNALEGKGSHLVTVNDYLARLGAGWMGPIYELLGVSVGIIIPNSSFIYDVTYSDDEQEDPRLVHMRPCTRQEAYGADITYGTNNEFGFDYLRDNMIRSLDQVRQRDLHYAIVDEVDSILIDEARTPLIISAPSIASNNAYDQFSKIVAQLKPEHYTKDEKLRSVVLTDLGIEAVQKILGVGSLYAVENIRNVYHLEQAMRAQLLFERDKHYVVTKDSKVVIVDESTGRLLPGRRYNEGLHQAIEAKEGVEVQQESMTLAKVSFQNLFRLYNKLAGMTGTAATEREEFYQIYKLDVIVIPTNEPIIRKDHPDVVYRTEEVKFNEIVKEVKQRQAKGQPILIGTSSIEKNERLAKLLTKANVKHEVLNAKNNAQEARIVAQAGQKGVVTLATNIAGRGTDIVLGKGVVGLGGLFVIGSERHEARRIDNQLRGRGGRQGDPGESQFFISFEDNLMRIYGDKSKRLMAIASAKLSAISGEEMAIRSRLVNKRLEDAQKSAEGFNFESRKNVVEYDDVMNKHRLATYSTRRKLLEEVDMSDQVKEFLLEEVKHLASLPGQDDAYEKSLVEIFPFDDPTLDKIFAQPADQFEEALRKEALKFYKKQSASFGQEAFEAIQRDIYFQVLDNLWMNHLEQMEHSRQGVQWVGVGQRSPLVEYRRQAQTLYASMQANLRRTILKVLNRARPVTLEELERTDVESNLTRAAHNAVDNARRILKTKSIDETDFKDSDPVKALTDDNSKNRLQVQKKKKRKQERQNRKKGRR